MSGITIQINAGSTLQASSAHATGSLRHIITDEERGTFGILDRDLKRKVGEYKGKEPTDAYVRSPTPWNDLYTTYGWDQVETVLVPINARILSINMVPTILSEVNFENAISQKKTINDARISHEVSNSAETTWSQNYSLSFTQEIHYDVSFLGSGGGGSTSFGFEAQWGKNFTKTHTTTVSTQAGMSVELEPNEKVVLQLGANSGTMKVRVTYETYLTGYAAVNYYPKFENHHFYAIPVSEVLGASNRVEVTEDIDIGYYCQVRGIIKDEGSQG